jgi:hypothetical protein
MEGIDSGFVHAIIDRFDSVGLEILEPVLGRVDKLTLL